MPVGYYDLSVAGVPVHSTAFRPIDVESLNRNPFRIVTSLLRLELPDQADGGLSSAGFAQSPYKASGQTALHGK